MALPCLKKRYKKHVLTIFPTAGVLSAGDPKSCSHSVHNYNMTICEETEIFNEVYM